MKSFREGFSLRTNMFLRDLLIIMAFGLVVIVGGELISRADVYICSYNNSNSEVNQSLYKELDENLAKKAQKKMTTFVKSDFEEMVFEEDNIYYICYKGSTRHVLSYVEDYLKEGSRVGYTCYSTEHKGNFIIIAVEQK